MAHFQIVAATVVATVDHVVRYHLHVMMIQRIEEIAWVSVHALFPAHLGLSGHPELHIPVFPMHHPEKQTIVATGVQIDPCEHLLLPSEPVLQYANSQASLLGMGQHIPLRRKRLGAKVQSSSHQKPLHQHQPDQGRANFLPEGNQNLTKMSRMIGDRALDEAQLFLLQGELEALIVPVSFMVLSMFTQH